MRKFTGDTLVLATHNKGKILELRDMLEEFVPNVVSAADLKLPEPPETGTTFHDNATIKALAAARATQHPALAEDSGLCVNALGGAPGVYSADWAGHPRNFKLARLRVHQLMGNDPDRTAYYQTIFALAWPDGHVEYAGGQGGGGKIVWPPRGSGGFGYDPIFMPTGYAVTFGEMPIEQKKQISHRTEALMNLLELYF